MTNNPKPIRAVVTGGAGFIGSHLAEALVNKGWQVTVIDNLSTGRLENIQHLLPGSRNSELDTRYSILDTRNSDFETRNSKLETRNSVVPSLETRNSELETRNSPVSFVNGSITDFPLLQEHLKYVDYVFHEAAIASVPLSIHFPERSHETNLTGTLNVLRAARDNHVKKVIFASSSAIYGDPQPETMSPDLFSTGDRNSELETRNSSTPNVERQTSNSGSPSPETRNSELETRNSSVPSPSLETRSSKLETRNSPIPESQPPRPQSPYAVTKLAGEYYCQVFSQAYGLPTACLRYFNVYGSRQSDGSDYAAVIAKFIEKLNHNRRPVIYGDGLQTRDFVAVQDVVQANILAAETDAIGSYNIGSGEATSLNKLVEILLLLTGKTDLKAVHDNPRVGDIKHSLADISKARTIGYAPKIALANGLRQLMGIKLIQNAPLE